MIHFHGSAMFSTRMALPPGATLSVSLLQTNARGTRMLAQAGGMPASNSPVPFSFDVPRTLLQPGYDYALSASITDAHGRALWVQATPAPVDRTVADESVTLWLVRAVEPPRPATVVTAPIRRGPAYVVAEGREPQWSARIYGLGATRSMRTSIGHDDPLLQRYARVKRQRLNSGVVVYTTADGFISLTISPGTCRTHGSKKVLAWRAVLETPAASYRGCARGFP
ncbi:YbaY family lipoprotein [Metallibacterium scheffleri]|nr:YbaY family lipoprotein [Metallibacterium scheffleri]